MNSIHSLFTFGWRDWGLGIGCYIKQFEHIFLRAAPLVPVLGNGVVPSAIGAMARYSKSLPIALIFEIL